MKIMVPLNPDYSVSELVQAGADGFYLGFIPNHWLNSFQNSNFINRRGHNLSVNFTENTIINVLELCHKYNVPAYCTFNNHQYTQCEFEHIKCAINFLAEYNIDGIIASDINVLEYCKTIHMPTTLSTCATVYNRYACEFYKLFGVNRIILPRDVKLSEMENIIASVPDVEWETFIYHSPCRFSESVCLSNHGLYGNICKRFRNSPQILCKNKEYKRIVDYYYNKPLGSCGLCEIYKMNQIGVSWLKIVERTLPNIVIKETCKKVKYAIDLINTVDSESAFQRNVQYKEMCVRGNKCYYK